MSAGNSSQTRQIRTDRASKLVAASPETIYRAFVDPKAWVTWVPPKGMTAKLSTFEARVGGRYRMSLTYDRAEHAVRGKTSEHEDVVSGTFVELVPNERVVQQIDFDSDDPAFAGTMTMTWSLHPVAGGTEVRIVCENVPPGIRKEDHDVGLRATLDNLAEFTE